MKERKTRIDKGTIKIVERDELALPWIAEQGGINLDHLAVLLTRSQEHRTADTDKGRTPEIISPAGVKQVMRRWLKAGWVEYANPFRKSIHPGYIWLSHTGIQDFGLGFRYVGYSIGTLRHFDAVNQVRLWVESRTELESWISERILRRESGKQKHMPDAEIIFAGTRLAIEVELQRKSHKRLRDIMQALQAEYSGVWYFVNSESEAGVRLLAESYPIRIRRLDKILLNAEASGISP